MSDVMTPEQRSRCMSRIRARNTKPEMIVRRVLHRMGFRFRLHRRDLPGTPDIVLPKHRAVVFVHGCFWHRHPNCKYAYTPKARAEFWSAKFEGNIRRDRVAQDALAALGWNVLVIWECETGDAETLGTRLVGFLGNHWQGDRLGL